MNHTLTIGWLYPELMSTYGDRGNAIVLQKRCEWRGINIEIINIDQKTSDEKLKSVDLIFGGGAQDREQKIVIEDLHKKGQLLKDLIENGIPALFVCGAPQLFGKYYEPSVGTRIKGLGIFDMVSKHPGPKQDRLIGNVVAEVCWENINRHPGKAATLIGSHADDSIATLQNDIIIGFENHGGRTYLGANAKPFARVLKGYGNNGEDGTEGVVYKNAVGSYLHGPLLPKNPEIADWLIKTAIEVKYKKEIDLEPLDDSLEDKARSAMIKKLSIRL